jgi:flagellin
LAATDTTGAKIQYAFAITAVGTAATLGGQGSGAASGNYIGSAGVPSYSGSGQTQSGVVSGTYNLTIAGANGSATISVTAGASGGDKFSDVVDKINAVSNQTGVSAAVGSSGITLTDSVVGASQSVTATGQDQLLRGLGLLAADTANYTTSDALTAAEQKISTASAVGTDGTATLTAGSGTPVALTANGNRFSDAASGFSFDLNAVQGLTTSVAVDFNVSNSGTATLQVGANAGQNLNVSIGSMKAQDLGIASGNGAIDITSQSAASNAIKLIDSAIQTVSTQAATLGAVQNRLQSAMNNLAIQSENMQAAYSSITNVNMAQESTNLATAQILQQSGIAMLAQANQAPQLVLKLLG